MKRSAPGAKDDPLTSCSPKDFPGEFAGDVSTAAFTLDHAGHVTSWSPAAAELLGYAATEVIGRRCESLFPPNSRDGLAEAWDAVLRGASYRGVLPLRRGGDGAPGRAVVTCSPLTDGTGNVGLLCQVSDVERTRRAEAERAFVDALLQKSPFGLTMVDNDLRYIVVNDTLAEINGLPAEEHIGRQVKDVIFPADGGEYEKRIRGVLETGEPLHNLMVSGRTRGFRDQDRAWQVTLFRLAGRNDEILGLGGMVIDVTEKETALLEASAVRQRLALVNQASTQVGTTLEMAQTARELTEVAVPAFADVALVEVRSSLFDGSEFPPADSPVHTRRLAGLSVLNNPAARQLFFPSGDVSHPQGSPSHESLHTGTAFLAEKLDESVLASLAHDDDQARLLRESGLGSLIMVPLLARGRLLGIAVFGRSAERESMTEDDVKIARELATRVALCLDNARMYGNERRIAVELQRSMLPEEQDIPRRPGLEVAYHYRPSSRAARVGGDWFDVIPLSGHRIALVVGDMMGHDIRAAAKMGQLRTAMRTLARLDLEPVDLLTRLDDVVQKGATTPYATCQYAVYDTVTRRCSIANAGHPPPILRRGDKTTEVVDVAPGVPLGVGLGEADFATSDFTLPEDSTLVLYTDGLVERRGEDIDVGIDALRGALAASAASVKDLCERVVGKLRSRVEDDDLAVLMARVPALSESRFVPWTMPRDPKSVSHARAMVRRTLDAWGLHGLVHITQLLVSELVTNAVRHAQGDIELRLSKGRTLVCEVADDDDRAPRRRHADIEDEQGRGLALVSEFALAWGTRPTAAGKVVWFELGLPEQRA